jgi:hypothetical protein
MFNFIAFLPLVVFLFCGLCGFNMVGVLIVNLTKEKLLDSKIFLKFCKLLFSQQI